MVTLKREVVNRLNKSLKRFCKIFESGCMTYAMYRVCVFEYEDNVRFEFLLSTEKGVLKCRFIEFDTQDYKLYYSSGSNFSFKSEKEIYNEIYRLINEIADLGVPVSRFFFENNAYDDLCNSYVHKNAKGELDIYLEVNDKYSDTMNLLDIEDKERNRMHNIELLYDFSTLNGQEA